MDVVPTFVYFAMVTCASEQTRTTILQATVLREFYQLESCFKEKSSPTATLNKSLIDLSHGQECHMVVLWCPCSEQHQGGFSNTNLKFLDVLSISVLFYSLSRFLYSSSIYLFLLLSSSFFPYYYVFPFFFLSSSLPLF